MSTQESLHQKPASVTGSPSGEPLRQPEALAPSSFDNLVVPIAPGGTDTPADARTLSDLLRGHLQNRRPDELRTLITQLTDGRLPTQLMQSLYERVLENHRPMPHSPEAFLELGRALGGRLMGSIIGGSDGERSAAIRVLQRYTAPDAEIPREMLPFAEAVRSGVYSSIPWIAR